MPAHVHLHSAAVFDLLQVLVLMGLTEIETHVTVYPETEKEKQFIPLQVRLTHTGGSIRTLLTTEYKETTYL